MDQSADGNLAPENGRENGQPGGQPSQPGGQDSATIRLGGATGRGFLPGQSGNLRGPDAVRAEKTAAILEQIARSFGGVENLDWLELTRLQAAAELLATKPRYGKDRIAAVTVADRLISHVERGRFRRKGGRPSRTSFDELLRARGHGSGR